MTSAESVFRPRKGGRRFRTRGVSALLLVSAILLLCARPTAASADRFSFYAVYDRIAGVDTLGLSAIHNSAMSSDGRKVVVYGRSREGLPALFTLDADGSNVRPVEHPRDIEGILEIAISRDGRRAFLLHQSRRSIYKLEGGKVSKIFDVGAYGQVGGCDQIQATADGEWVFFMDSNRSVWKVGQAGGAPRRVLQIEQVRRDGGTAFRIGRFGISADGRTIAFVVNGYMDARGAYREKNEVFVSADGKIRQLSEDKGNVYKERLAISGDGRVIAYTAGAPQNRFRVVRSDGGGSRDVDDIQSVGPVTLNVDGSRLFYFDTSHNGGRMVRTDGSGAVDLFPIYNVGAIALGAPWSLSSGDSGDRIGFRVHDGVWVGHLGPSREVAGAPVIEEITMDPPITTAEEARVGTTLRARIRDPGGTNDILRTSTNVLMDGRTVGDSRKAPVFFYLPVNDTGVPPDPKGKDGVFCSTGQPGGGPDKVKAATVRVAAMDRSSKVVVADASLLGASGPPEGGAAPGPVAGKTGGVEERSVPGEGSPEQTRKTADVLRDYGPPDLFSIQFYTLDEDPDRIIRREQWYYFGRSEAMTFVDGVLLAAGEIGALPPGARLPSFRPEQFHPDMSFEEIARVTGIDSFVKEEIPDEEGDLAEIYHGRYLQAGFSNGALVVVESTPWIPGGGAR